MSDEYRIFRKETEDLVRNHGLLLNRISELEASSASHTEKIEGNYEYIMNYIGEVKQEFEELNDKIFELQENTKQFEFDTGKVVVGNDEKINELKERFEQSRIQDNVSWKGFTDKFYPLQSKVYEIISKIENNIDYARFEIQENRISELEKKVEALDKDILDTICKESAKHNYNLLEQEIAELEKNLKDYKTEIMDYIKTTNLRNDDRKQEIAELKEAGSARQTVTCKECTRKCFYKGSDCENCGFGTTEIEDSGGDGLVNTSEPLYDSKPSEANKKGYIQPGETITFEYNEPREDEPSPCCQKCIKDKKTKKYCNLYRNDCHHHNRLPGGTGVVVKREDLEYLIDSLIKESPYEIDYIKIDRIKEEYGID